MCLTENQSQAEAMIHHVWDQFHTHEKSATGNGTKQQQETKMALLGWIFNLMYLFLIKRNAKM